MFLHGETGWRLRRFALALVATILGWTAFAPSAGAVDTRHYEQVSPADKGQGDIVADGETTIAAGLGGGVAFSSRTPFGDEVGSGVDGQTQYVARRTSDAWVIHAVTPAGRSDAVQALFAPTKLETFSDDLSSAVVWAYDLPGGGGTPDHDNIYVEDTATRGLQPVTLSQVAPLRDLDFANMFDWGVSGDAQHVAFVTATQMLPNATAGRSNVYQWDAGRGLSLAGVLPDGTVPATGSNVTPFDYRRAMSADGSRLVFTAASQLYMRIDGNLTVPISTPSGNSPSAGVHLEAVTPDGHNVFFVTNSALLPTDPNSGPDLYRWTDSGDPAHDGTLTEISDTGDLNWSGARTGVIGVSDDGSRVYYQTLGAHLVVWNNGASRVISTDAAVDTVRFSLTAVASAPGDGRVTPDGMWLAFVTSATLGNDGIHAIAPDLAGTNASDLITNGHYEMYVYSLTDDSLVCVSCSSDAATSDASVVPDVTSGLPRLFNDAIRPRFLSDSGQVFFSTSVALVPEDVNGVEDVYEYDPPSADAPSWTLRLVSTGTGKEPTSFADASQSGDDVFVQTRQQLVSADQDNLVDLYDARTGPALTLPQQTPASDCQGDTCQPPPSASPPEDLFGSLSLGGSGNSSPVGKLLTVPVSVAVRGSVASLPVRLLAAGTLTWRGNGVQSGSAKHGSGALKVRVRLGRRARTQVKTKGRYVTRIRLTLVQQDGTRVSAITRVTFRAAAKKGR